MPSPSLIPTEPGFARSPFPGIADYGFLSDCETTALVAPGGSIEWMCLPRMDSASVFGSLLDRDAGKFRLGPAGVNVPTARRYLPGTMVLETSWGTKGGWIIVRDALLIGPWHHSDDRSNTHRRAPTDYDADHVLLRTVRCVNGEVQLSLVCEPAFDYGRTRGRWDYAGSDYHDVAVTGARRPRAAPGERPQPRHRGPARHRAAPDEGGRAGLLRAVLDRAPGAAHVRGRLRPARLDRPPLAALARPRRVPRPPVAQRSAAQRAHAQGPHLRADRRGDRRRHHLAAGDAGRRAQLGLPLHVDPRRHVRALGPLHAGVRLGGERLLLLRGRRRRGRAGPAPDHVRHRRPRRAARADPRPPLGLRERTPGPDRQRRPLPGPARRVGRGARLGLPAHQVARLPAGTRVAAPGPAGRGRDRQLARPRPRHLGGARRPEALHLVEAHVLGRARPRRAARRAARGLGPRDAVARASPTRSTPTSASTRSTSGACSPSTTTRPRSTRRCC